MQGIQKIHAQMKTGSVDYATNLRTRPSPLSPRGDVVRLETDYLSLVFGRPGIFAQVSPPFNSVFA